MRPLRLTNSATLPNSVLRDTPPKRLLPACGTVAAMSTLLHLSNGARGVSLKTELFHLFQF
jgi:hypothetical protein